MTPRELNAGDRGGGRKGGRRAEEEGDGGGGGGSARGGGFWRVNVFFLFSGIEERVTRARMELFARSERYSKLAGRS